MREIKFRLRTGNEVIGYERWHKGDGSDAHWEHLKIGETVWCPAFLHATDRDLFTGLHDKNGKEIYHFDWLKDSNKIVEIGWYGYRWDYAVIKGAYSKQPRLLDLVVGAQIIGNKYEGR